MNQVDPLKNQSLARILIFYSVPFSNVLFVAFATILIKFEVQEISDIILPYVILIALAVISVFIQVVYITKSPKLEFTSDFESTTIKGLIRLAILEIPAWLGLIYFIIVFGLL